VNLFRFIDAERAYLPVALLCRMLGVSRSGYSTPGDPGRHRRGTARTPPSLPRSTRSIEGAGKPTDLRGFMPS
jgi:hypothetical protein